MTCLFFSLDKTNEALSDLERRLSAVNATQVLLPTGPVRRVFFRHLDATSASVIKPWQLKVPGEKNKHFTFANVFLKTFMRLIFVVASHFSLFLSCHISILCMFVYLSICCHG